MKNPSNPSDSSAQSPAIEFGTHIKFVPAPSKPKTLVWGVVNKYDDGWIGWVSWYAAWRKYSYFPRPETVYEQVCLREIAAFCERKTREHKLQALITRQEAPENIIVTKHGADCECPDCRGKHDQDDPEDRLIDPGDA